MQTTRGRQVYANQLVLEQADFFQSDGFTRVTGLTASQVQQTLTFNNVAQPWPLVDGGSIPDAQTVSGRIYYSEIPGLPGVYSVRFRPNAVGYWRMTITYVPGQQIVAQDYDVLAQLPATDQGLKPSFTKPGTGC
jgi:hypothetical protein